MVARNGGPSPNGPNGSGRDAGGRFAKGCAGGPGNPHAAATAKLHAKLLASITDADIDKAIDVIRECMTGKDGKPADKLAAARELLDRGVGRASQTGLQEEVAALRHELAELAKQRSAFDLRNFSDEELAQLESIVRAAGRRAGLPVNGE
jgi:hypothetical protein